MRRSDMVQNGFRLQIRHLTSNRPARFSGLATVHQDLWQCLQRSLKSICSKLMFKLDN